MPDLMFSPLLIAKSPYTNIVGLVSTSVLATLLGPAVVEAQQRYGLWLARLTRYHRSHYSTQANRALRVNFRSPLVRVSKPDAKHSLFKQRYGSQPLALHQSMNSSVPKLDRKRQQRERGNV